MKIQFITTVLNFFSLFSCIELKAQNYWMIFETFANIAITIFPTYNEKFGI